jgi:hypothetical protein
MVEYATPGELGAAMPPRPIDLGRRFGAVVLATLAAFAGLVLVAAAGGGRWVLALLAAPIAYGSARAAAAMWAGRALPWWYLASFHLAILGVALHATAMAALRGDRDTAIMGAAVIVASLPIYWQSCRRYRDGETKADA